MCRTEPARPSGWSENASARNAGRLPVGLMVQCTRCVGLHLPDAGSGGSTPAPVRCLRTNVDTHHERASPGHAAKPLLAAWDVRRPASPGHDVRVTAGRSERSKWSIASEDSLLCIASRGSVLSIGSIGSALSIGSIGSFGSAFSVGSFVSAVSLLSAVSVLSVLSWSSRVGVLRPVRPAPSVRSAGGNRLGKVDGLSIVSDS